MRSNFLVFFWGRWEKTLQTLEFDRIVLNGAGTLLS